MPLLAQAYYPPPVRSVSCNGEIILKAMGVFISRCAADDDAFIIDREFCQNILYTDDVSMVNDLGTKLSVDVR